jgi:ribosome-binding ATPase YchF (GTP1/OBG family)
MEILNETGLINKKISKWKEEELKIFVDLLVKKTKPMVIVANKIDLPTSHKNYERIKEKFKEYYVIPASAEAELALIRANKNGIIEYLPGSPYFKIISSNITEKQRKALEFIEKNILKKYGSTGVIDALEISCFKVLKYITVFPVEDQNKMTDHHGNVLPDAFLVPYGTTAREFAYMIHTELGKNFIYAIDVRKKQKLGEDYILQDRDVIKIVAGS